MGRHLCANSFFNINPTPSFEVILIFNIGDYGTHLNKGMSGIVGCLFQYKLFLNVDIRAVTEGKFLCFLLQDI